MNNITKGDFIKFIKSYKINYIEDDKLRRSIGNLQDACYRFFLHDKPDNYILKNWEYNAALYEKTHNDYFLDLRPIFEVYYKGILREKQINILLNE
jgi:hypothetical protein